MTPEEFVIEQTSTLEISGDILPTANQATPETILEKIKSNPRYKALALIVATFGVPVLMSVLVCGNLDNQKNSNTQGGTINFQLPTPTSWQQQHNAPFYAQATLEAAPTPTPEHIIQHNYIPSLQSTPDYSLANPPVPGQP